MELYLLRHGIAVDREKGEYSEDHLRPLTSKGKKKTLLIAKGMKTLGISFDLILSSPYIRAKETALAVANVFKMTKKVHFLDVLGAEQEPKYLVDELQKHYSDAESLLLVGHEPFLSAFISLLLCGNSNVCVSLKKAGLCKLMVDTLKHGPCATLEWLLTPRHFLRMK